MCEQVVNVIRRRPHRMPGINGHGVTDWQLLTPTVRERRCCSSQFRISCIRCGLSSHSVVLRFLWFCLRQWRCGVDYAMLTYITCLLRFASWIYFSFVYFFVSLNFIGFVTVCQWITLWYDTNRVKVRRPTSQVQRSYSCDLCFAVLFYVAVRRAVWRIRHELLA